MYNNNVKEPLYFHREYENDLPKQEPKMEGSSQALRVAKVALPFVALYRPFGSTLACGLSVARTVTTLRECFAAEDFQKLSWALFNTCLAVGSVAGTIFFHPLGMLITTLNDIGINIYHVYSAVSQGEMYKAGKQTMRIANNTFYLSVLILGSIELQLASLVLQVLVEGSESYEEFNKGNILEMIGHLGMCMVRGSQSYAQFEMVQRKWTVASISQKVSVPKLCAAGKASSLEFACLEKGKWHPALGALKEQHQGYLVYADIKVVHEDDKCYFRDEIGINLLPEVKAVADKGDLVAVWLDADSSEVSKELLGDLDVLKDHFAGLDKSLYISHYNASTGLWSQPNGLAMGKIPEEGLNWSLMSADPIGNALILLKDANKDALEAITFDSMVNSWSSPIQLADNLPNVTAFDGDAFGNCTLVWNDKDKLFTTRTYDANSKTWNLPVSFKKQIIHGEREVIDLIVRRDQDSNIAILAEAGNPDYKKVTFVTKFNGKDMQWFIPELVNLNEEAEIVDLISMGKGQFTAVFADEKIISSLLLSTAHSHCSYLKQIKSSAAEIEEIVVDKDRFGNPVVAWKETLDDDEMFYRELSDEALRGSDMASIFEKISNSTKIHVANFDSTKNDWNKTEVASGFIIDRPKLGKVKGDLYLFWDEFTELVFPKDKSSDDLILKININGMKWEEAKSEWNPMGTISQCPMKQSPIVSNFYYEKSIDEDGLHVIWKDGEEYLKKTTPL